MSSDPVVAGASDPEAVPRKFGFWTGHFVVVSSMIGAGILGTSGFTLRDTGNPAGLVGLWLLGGLMAWAGAVTVAELATRLSRTGGDYIFVREAFGPEAGFVAGWATFVIGFIAPTAVVARLAAGYLTAPFMAALDDTLPAGLLPHLVRLLASAIILSMTVVHCLGHHESSRLQGVATVLKIAVLATLVGAGMTYGQGSWRHLQASAWPSQEQWPALAIGLIYVGYAYAGWNGAAYLAGEIRDPIRLLPRCLLAGTATVTALYLLVNLTYIYALDPQVMTTLPADQVEKVAELAIQHLFGPSVAGVASVMFGLGLFASVSAYLLTGPRVAFAMSKDGVFPRWAGRLHATRRVPLGATLTQGLVATALIWSGTFLDLLDYASVGLAAASGLVVASVFALRRRNDLPHPYRLPFYPFPPLLYLALVVWTVGYTVTQSDRRLPAWLSLATLALGLPLARLIYRRRRSAGDIPTVHPQQ